MTAETFNNIFLEHKDRAMRWAWSILGNKEDAEDVVQDVYEKLWRRRLLIRQNGFKSLIMTTVHNTSIDLKRQRPTTTTTIQENKTENTNDSSDTLLIDHIFQVISTLPEKQQIAVTLHDIEGLDTSEIALETGLSPEAIRMALSRGRTTLRDKISKIINYGINKQE